MSGQRSPGAQSVFCFPAFATRPLPSVAADEDWEVPTGTYVVTALSGVPSFRVSRIVGGRPGAWILQQDQAHGPHALRVVADLAGGDLAAAEPLRQTG